MASTTATPRAIELGALLRRLRTRAEVSQTALGKELGRSNSHVSRWETGRLLIEIGELERFLALCAATSEETAEALRLHRHASDPSWLQLGGGGTKDLMLLAEYERSATSIIAVQPSLIPGPLQTAGYARDVMTGYARDVMSGGGASGEQVESWTARRMDRREAVLSTPTAYTAFIGEQAIRYPACTLENASDQLRDLCTVAELAHVTIRIIPFRIGYDPSREGGFVLVRSEDSSVVHLEELTTAVTLSRGKEVDRYLAAAARMQEVAMDADASVNMIARIADELEA